jgi:hypothetical protein
MTGSVIFLTITALPESDAHTSFDLKERLCSNTFRMDSATAPASMIAPSTMASAGTGSAPYARTRKPLPDGFNSTAFTALDPMSSPTTDLFFPSMPNIRRSLFDLDRDPGATRQRPCHAPVDPILRPISAKLCGSDGPRVDARLRPRSTKSSSTDTSVAADVHGPRTQSCYRQNW